MQCDCHLPLHVAEVEELSSDAVFVKLHCDSCGASLGVEGKVNELDSLVTKMIWTDEAQYQLSRLPPYLATLVRDEVETFAHTQQQQILTYFRVNTARNKGMVDWTPEAEGRLANIPSGIRAMAKIELERTALDRGMAAVTIALMDEVKSRYFGMATVRSKDSFRKSTQTVIT